MKNIWSMFDGSGLAALPFAEKGHKVKCFNFDGADHGDYAKHNAKVIHSNIEYVNVFIDWAFEVEAMEGKHGKPDFIMAFPPCTDLAVSGSRHFASKREKDPEFQNKAARTARIAANIAEKFGVPYMIENPVSVLSSLWRKPDHVFTPYEYGGYLPENDVHPWFPQFIAPRDKYQKKTCLWTSERFIMPERKSVGCPDEYSTQYYMLGGKSAKTKLIRSLSPRGFFAALANSTFC